jgi:hypothetical protein
MGGSRLRPAVPETLRDGRWSLAVKDRRDFSRAVTEAFAMVDDRPARMVAVSPTGILV